MYGDSSIAPPYLFIRSVLCLICGIVSDVCCWGALPVGIAGQLVLDSSPRCAFRYSHSPEDASFRIATASCAVVPATLLWLRAEQLSLVSSVQNSNI